MREVSLVPVMFWFGRKVSVGTLKLSQLLTEKTKFPSSRRTSSADLAGFAVAFDGHRLLLFEPLARTSWPAAVMDRLEELPS